MRTKTILLSAAALVAGLLSSQAQSNVYSANVVGYANSVMVGGGKYTLIANPLNAPTNTLGALLSTLPSGSQVQKWNPGIGDFDSYTKTGFGAGWSPASGATTSLAPGEGVFVFINVATNVTNTFVGEVLQGSLTNSFIPGFNLVANMVPDSGVLTNNNTLQLTNIPTGSQLQQWDVSIQDFHSFTKTGFGTGWSPNPPTINVGEGFFLNANGSFKWVRNFNVQ